MKKYLFVYRTSLQRFIEYRSELAIDLIGKILIPIFVQLVLWQAIILSSQTGEVSGYKFADLTRYLILSILVFNLMRVDNIEREIARAIREGDLNKYLTKPIDFMIYHFMIFLADSTPLIAGTVITYAFLTISGIVVTPMINVLLGTSVIVLAIFVAYMMSFLTGMLAFVMDEIWTISAMKSMTLWFLTGQLIPLDMFPERAQTIMQFLPFGYLSYFPTKIFIDSFSLQEIIFGLEILFGWTIIFYLLYRISWYYAVRVYSAYGG